MLLQKKLLFSVALVAVLRAVDCGMFDATPPPEGQKFKEEADKNQMTEEQFFRCFSDINCKMGQEGKEAVWECFRKVSPEEITEYCSWFKDCPVANFPIPEVEEINKVFCQLNYEEQEEFDKFFMDNIITKLKEVCNENQTSGKCFRLNRSQNCMSKLIEEKSASGECDTAARKLHEGPGAK